MTDLRDTMRWTRRGIAIAALLIGWLFIAWKNHFHVTAPLVFICLGYLAVVATIYNLWRTGAAAVDTSEDEGDSTWAQPVGALGDLEREKRTLLKAIKETEFDHQMGKLSQRDADDMIRSYRVRAIEVIKDIERLELGAAGTVREQILREVRARVLLESKAPRAAVQAKPSARAAGKRARGKRAEAAAGPAAGKDGAQDAPAVERAPGAVERAPEVEPGAASAGTQDAANDVHGEPAAAQAAPEVVRPRDDELDADSTTALEPRASEPAKEATR